jgi:hypothetical protein
MALSVVKKVELQGPSGISIYFGRNEERWQQLKDGNNERCGSSPEFRVTTG